MKKVTSNVEIAAATCWRVFATRIGRASSNHEPSNISECGMHYFLGLGPVAIFRSTCAALEFFQAGNTIEPPATEIDTKYFGGTICGEGECTVCLPGWGPVGWAAAAVGRPGRRRRGESGGECGRQASKQAATCVLCQRRSPEASRRVEVSIVPSSSFGPSLPLS